jgi:inorganic triphosphatase YgiF
VTEVLEVELKLRGGEAPLAELALAERLGPATLGPARAVEEIDVYLDTADGALAAAGWACRLRAREGRRWISCKGPAQHAPGDALQRRAEVDGPAPAGDDEAVALVSAWPPSAARDLVSPLAGDALLGERVTLRQQRTERRVAVDGRDVGTLSLDRVAVTRGGAEHGGFAVVELELDADVDAAAVARVLDALGAWPALEPDALSKLERAIGLLP